MFGSGRKHATDSFSKHRAGKSTSSKSRRSFRDNQSARRPAQLDLSMSKQSMSKHANVHTNVPSESQLKSATITLVVGQNPPRLFAAHTDVLMVSPFFQSALRSNYYNSSSRQLTLQEEVPEVFACILEFLYKSDYFPKLEYDTRRQTWSLESGDAESTVWIPASSGISPAAMSPTSLQPNPANPGAGQGIYILKDTAVYCAAERFSLPQLKRVALRKQGLQSGIPVTTILSSARYAYAQTPESDRHLRAHYLALIIRSRNTFKRSGTMQVEMGMASPRLGNHTNGSTGLWFDLFVAMCNHLDDLEAMKSPRKS